jgi:hypothetical protein
LLKKDEKPRESGGGRAVSKSSEKEKRKIDRYLIK